MDSTKNLVFIAGPWDNLVAGLFMKAGWAGTKNLEMADLVVFTGGADINPSLYGEKPDGAYGANQRRDDIEVAAFHSAKEFGIPMVGICRGAQLLNVMNGGSLWQDVDNHTANHDLIDVRSNKIFKVTSTHHQQMKINAKLGNMIAIAHDPNTTSKTSLCKRKRGEGITQLPNKGDVDPEVIWYNDTQCLCFQPHPEYPGNTQTAEYFWEIFNELFAFEEPQIAQESA